MTRKKEKAVGHFSFSLPLDLEALALFPHRKRVPIYPTCSSASFLRGYPVFPLEFGTIFQSSLPICRQPPPAAHLSTYAGPFFSRSHRPFRCRRCANQHPERAFSRYAHPPLLPVALFLPPSFFFFFWRFPGSVVATIPSEVLFACRTGSPCDAARYISLSIIVTHRSHRFHD